MKEKQRKINDSITSKRVQVIKNDGENLGEMNISEAREMANKLGFDLMEIGKSGEISIVKLLDYGKFLYRQKKQDQKNKQKGKAPDLKTIRITFKIGEHDLAIRKKQAQKFGAAHHPLKVTLMLRGRENHYSELAMEKMKSFIESISDVYKLEGEIKRGGNIFSALLKIKK